MCSKGKLHITTHVPYTQQTQTPDLGSAARTTSPHHALCSNSTNCSSGIWPAYVFHSPLILHHYDLVVLLNLQVLYPDSSPHAKGMAVHA